MACPDVVPGEVSLVMIALACDQYIDVREEFDYEHADGSDVCHLTRHRVLPLQGALADGPDIRSTQACTSGRAHMAHVFRHAILARI
jgi:hypothetical protein